MDRKEYKKFAENCRMIFSALFARRMSSVLIGVSSRYWIFTNLRYKPHPDPKKHVDDFITYTPGADDIFHAVSLTPGYYKDVKGLFEHLFDPSRDENDLVENHYQMMIKAPWLLSAVNQVKSQKDWSTVTFTLSTNRKQTHLYLNAWMRDENGQLFDGNGNRIGSNDGEKSVSTHVGYIFTLHRTSRIQDIIEHTVDQSYATDGTSRDLKKEESYRKDINIIRMRPFEVAAGRIETDGDVAIPVLDGKSTASIHEYGKRSDSPVTHQVHVWRRDHQVWDSAVTLRDEYVQAFSYLPGMNHFLRITSESATEKENDVYGGREQQSTE